MTFGTPLAVLLVGREFGGTGGYGWSFLGMLVGEVPAVVLEVASFGACFRLDLFGTSTPPDPSCPYIAVAAVTLAVTGTVAGAVIGYELSNDPEPRSQSARAFHLAPTLAPVPGGAIAGVILTM